MILFKPNVAKMEKKKDVKGLIKALKHKDLKTRRETVKALRRIGDTRAVEPLIQALKDEEIAIRRLAIITLGYLEDGRAVEPIIQALNDENLRFNAALALARLGDGRAVEPLIEFLKSENLDVRKIAVSALGATKDSRAVEPLIEALKDKDRDVQIGAIKSLGEIGDARAVKPLLQTLKPILQTLTSKEDREVNTTAEAALVEIGEPAVKTLIQVMRGAEREARSRTTGILDKLGWKPKDDTEQAYYLIAKSKWNELEQLGKSAIEPLTQALEDKSWMVRISAAEVLSKMGDDRGIELLALALKKCDNRGDRQDAVKALQRIKDGRVVEPLIEALSDGDLNVRVTAAKTLGEIGDTRAVEPLIKTLDDSRERVQHSVIHALGEIGDLRAAVAIINWAFTSGNKPSIRHEKGLNSWIETTGNLFGDYTILILKSSMYIESRREEDDSGLYHGGAGEYHHDLHKSTEAIKELCKIRTQISSNILHKVLQKRDIKVIVGWVCDFLNYGILSFESQREMAKKELERRGNPPYDPSAYLKKEAWKLSNS